MATVVTPPPPPPPTCTRAAPTLTLTGPSGAVAAGTQNTYAVSLKNNDSSGCANATFSLARSVPSGWTGTLSSTSIVLAPGASGSATLAVTSATSAAGGTYGIGVGASSAVGAEHTQNASATYSVAAAVANLTESLGTNKTSYLAGEAVAMAARVLNNGVPVAGAYVTFTVTKPSGGTTALRGTTDANGYAHVSYATGKGKNVVGNYQVTADASSNGLTAKASTSFSVYR
jgi:hypothetical protein